MLTAVRKQPRHCFEIGVVYRNKKNRLFLAVDKHLLVTFVLGTIVEITPKTKPFVSRSVNVESLCEAWDISMDRLDEMSSEYFSPVRNDKVKRRLPDKFRDSETMSQVSMNSLWATLRTHKVIGTP